MQLRKAIIKIEIINQEIGIKICIYQQFTTVFTLLHFGNELALDIDSSECSF